MPTATLQPRPLARLAGVLAAALAIALAAPANAQLLNENREQTRGVDVEEHLGRTLPLEQVFTDAEGKQVRLGDYFKDNKPAILGLVYYDCPIVCDVVMEKLAQSIKDLDLVVGKDFNVLMFSFDPAESTEIAAKIKLGYVSGYDKGDPAQVAASWQFHTSDATSSRNLAEAVGFRYKPLANGEWSHPVVLYTITPDGRVSHYIYGFNYPPRDLKLSLMEASSGRLVKTIGDRLLNFCYMYDPTAGKYTLKAVRVMQVAGVITMASLGSLIGALLVGERLRRRARAASVARAGGQSARTLPTDPAAFDAAPRGLVP